MMHNNMMVSVVMPAYNEEESIYETVKDFSKEYVDEIIVVDNNSIDETVSLAERAGARVVEEEKQGLGFALQKGLKEAKGDIIIMTESDATFIGDDMPKLLSYIDDVDMVLGTRLTDELLEKGAKIDWFLHWGNLSLAKLVQLKFWKKVRLTDVGCTFRAIKKQALDKIIDQFTTGESHFLVDMTIVALENSIRTVEIPVHYKKRVGHSKITSDKIKSLKVGFKMLNRILRE